MPVPEHVRAPRAVFDASAQAYVDFVGTEIGAETEDLVDRALLAAFAELVPRAPGLPVADLGCGPGRAAAVLRRSGLDVLGIDLSAALLRTARDAHPGISFLQGQLDSLPLPGGALAGVVCWYSVIYTPPARLDEVFAEVARVLHQGGLTLLGFQAGEGAPIHNPDAYNSGLSMTSYRHDPVEVGKRLEASGFVTHAKVVRAPVLRHESTDQAFILARRRAST